MKKVTIALAILFTLSAAVVSAQDYKQAKKIYDLGVLTNTPSKLEDAKLEIDKVLAVEKERQKPENWLLKMQIYAAIASNESISSKYPEVGREAADALNKYLELEPAETKLKADKFEGVNAIYNSLFTRGLKDYQNKNWEAAHAKFKAMAEFGDLLITRKWTAATFDTTAYLYAGATAQNAKKDEVAAQYYGKLADLKLKGENYEGIYDFLTKYYLNINNEVEFKKYLALAKEVYAENSLWADLDFLFMSKNYTPDQMAKKFDEEEAANKLNATSYADYGNYFVGDEKIKEIEEAKRMPYTLKAMKAFGKAYTLDTTNGIAAYNAGVTAYNVWELHYDAARQMKGTTPEIKAKRAEQDKVADGYADQAIGWMEKSFKTLEAKKDRSNLETTLLNKSVDFLYNLYQYKRERTRGVAPKDYDKYDAKMTYYDSLHNKFK